MKKLLKEEGYEDAKLLFICISRNEKEQTRIGKTSKKYTALENKDDLCIHCGKKRYLKYCYLGISTKVKNWFKNVDMCRKMLCHWNARDKYWLGRQSSNPEKSEFWDLNNTWTLPALCPQWRLPISSDQLINSPHGMEVKMWNFQTALKSLNTVLESLMHLL